MNDRVAKTEQIICGTIREEEMLPDGCRVIIGLSGGADSMTLAHFLLGYAAEHRIALVAAHVNHGLRGAESDADEAFVASWCAVHGMDFRVLHADIAREAGERSQGVEECGRNVRYSFFRSLCGPNDRIATAHTLSDSAETVLMNLAKGAGAAGLSGIPPARNGIVRPLIRITREQVEEYCRHYGLRFVTDSTNGSDDYMRNRVRHGAVPILRQINPEFEQAILRTTGLLSRDEEYFRSLAEAELGKASGSRGEYSMERLRRVPAAVLSRMIPLAIHRETDARLECVHVAAVGELIRSGKGSVSVPGGIQCIGTGNTLFIVPGNRTMPPWSVPLCLPATRLPDGRLFCVHRVFLEIKNWKINNLLFNNRINYDTILKMNSVIRSRAPGDLFTPAGRGITKTVKKLLNEQKIPPFLRSRLAVLECGGRIVWIEGIGASQDAAVSQETREAAEITIREC